MFTRHTKCRTVITAVIVLEFHAQAILAQSTEVVYVDKVGGSVSPPGEGDAWGTDHAYMYLQDALLKADALLAELVDPPDLVEIWVAGVDDADGNVYYPSEGSGLTISDRSQTFNLRENVHILCGFEAGVHEEANERDWRKFKVTLSGDIDDDDVLDDDNSYHVLRAYFVDASAWIDGATITGGYADNELIQLDNRGGGMLILGGEIDQNEDTCQPVVLRCRFTGNHATAEGGAVFVKSNHMSDPHFRNCQFDNNEAGAPSPYPWPEFRLGARRMSQRQRQPFADKDLAINEIARWL